MPIVHILEKVVKNSNEKYGTVKNMGHWKIWTVKNMDSEKWEVIKEQVVAKSNDKCGTVCDMLYCFTPVACHVKRVADLIIN